MSDERFVIGDVEVSFSNVEREAGQIPQLDFHLTDVCGRASGRREARSCHQSYPQCSFSRPKLSGLSVSVESEILKPVLADNFESPFRYCKGIA